MVFRRRRPTAPEGKMVRYVHAITTFEKDGLKAAIHEDGKVTLSRENGEDGEDVIENISADFIFKLSSMLNITKKVTFVDKK